MTDDPFELPHGDEFRAGHACCSYGSCTGSVQGDLSAGRGDHHRARSPGAGSRPGAETIPGSVQQATPAQYRAPIGRPSRASRRCMARFSAGRHERLWRAPNAIAHGDSPSDIAKMIGRLGNNATHRTTANPRDQPGFLGLGLGRRLARRCGNPVGLVQAETLRTTHTRQRHATEASSTSACHPALWFAAMMMNGAFCSAVTAMAGGAKIPSPRSVAAPLSRRRDLVSQFTARSARRC